MVDNAQVVEPVEGLSAWEFDVKAVNNVDALASCLYYMLDTIGVLSIGVDPVTLQNLILAVVQRYSSTHFHNARHAVFVTHFVFMLLRDCQPSDDSSMPSPSTLPMLVKFALLVSSLSHDVGHRGTSNSFEIKTKSSLAETYKNQSVLENMHHSILWEIIETEDGSCDITKNMSSEDANQFREIVFECIMATDMSQHNRIVEEIEASVNVKQDLTDFKVQIQLCRFLIHAADLSNPTRDFGTSKYWAEQLSCEFYSQVEQERALGLSPDPWMIDKGPVSLMKSEIFFITKVAGPLWDGLYKLYPSLVHLIDHMKDNVNQYTELIAGSEGSVEEEQKK